MERRTFVAAAALGGTAFALTGGWPTLMRRAAAADGTYGPLQPADSNGFRLPTGFSSRVVATTGQLVAGTSYRWHSAPDGGATFATADGGWIYVSNAEVSSGRGGVGMLRFAADGSIVEARSILSGTTRNCAGGATPWGTWLSCEETSTGQVWECDPTGATAATARPAMGRFNHEAAAVDPIRRHIYLTEDAGDGGLYRFIPTSYPNLSTGTLQVLTEQSGQLGWATVNDPDGSPTPTRDQVPAMRQFDGGEGLWWDAISEKVWFTSKGDNRVWTYDPARNELTVVYDDDTSPTPVLTGVDNLTVSASGDVFVCEDGGNMEIVLLATDGTVTPFARLTGVSGSELAGVAFDPSGGRLYVSSQRNPGRTYEITGPFRGATGGGTTTTTTTSTTVTSTTVPTTTTSTTTTSTTAPTTTSTTVGGITLSATGHQLFSWWYVRLEWSGASGASVEIIRDGQVVATTTNDGSHVDWFGRGDGSSHTYRVCDASGTCSNDVTVFD